MVEKIPDFIFVILKKYFYYTSNITRMTERRYKADFNYILKPLKASYDVAVEMKRLFTKI